MRKETFLYLCQTVQHIIGRNTTQLRKCISTEKRVAITLWCLSTPSEYRSIAHLFGVSRGSVCRIVQETCSAIVSTMLEKYIRFPTGEDLTNVINGFKSKWGFPQCVGAIDGSHIPIAAPELNHTDYYNRKGWYSMILQGVVDHDYLFCDICVGWPGSVHDARVFASSSIVKRIKEGLLSAGQSISYLGCQIPAFLIGDSAYPLQT